MAYYPEDEVAKTTDPYYDGDGPVQASVGRLGGLSSRLPLSHQEKAIAELHEMINQLATRLKPVLTPVNEVNENRKEGEEAREVVSPLTDHLNANNRGIYRASENLRGLMERLEC